MSMVLSMSDDLSMILRSKDMSLVSIDLYLTNNYKSTLIDIYVKHIVMLNSNND